MKKRQQKKTVKAESADRREGEGGMGVTARKLPRPEPPRELVAIAK